MTPPPPSTRVEGQLVARVRASCASARPQGLTTIPIAFEIRNLGLPELADPARCGEIVAQVTLIKDGRRRPLLEEPLPAAIPLGSTASLEQSVHLDAFVGRFDLLVELRRAGAAETLAIDYEPLPLHVTYPIQELFLEVTNACNFRCDFCPQGDLLRKPGILDLDLARKVMGDLAAIDHAAPIRLHLLGEPLLYPHFEELMGIVHANGQRVRLATNGSRFAPETIEMILRSKVDELMISLNTPDREDFRTSRGTRMTYDAYMQSIHRFTDAFMTRKSGPPRTWINFLFDGASLGEASLNDAARELAAEWVERARGLGVEPPGDLDAIELGPYETYFELAPDLTLQWTPYHDWGSGPSSGERFCVLPWKQLAILVDGKVTACCLDHDGEIVLGDVHDQSVEEIWEGRVLEALRTGFLADERVHTKCQSCTVRHDRSAFPALS